MSLRQTFTHSPSISVTPTISPAAEERSRRAQALPHLLHGPPHSLFAPRDASPPPTHSYPFTREQRAAQSRHFMNSPQQTHSDFANRQSSIAPIQQTMRFTRTPDWN
jgi:hypothetical protein